MIFAEPMTMLTDYILTGVAGWLGWLLWRAREDQKARFSWALALAALALAAALGGTYHGFAPQFSEGILHLLWKVTVLAAGVAGYGMLVGSIIAVTIGSVRKILLVVVTVKFTIYSLWMLLHSEFMYVILDSGVAMGTVAALHGWSAVRRGDRASLWMLGGVVVSVFAAGVQASGFALHRHFNHNDLYHMIQIAGIALFYLGARGLRDR